MQKQFSISEDTNCPICFDIPKNEVFQCVNGHTICSDCLEKVSKCPSCCLPYDAVKIRNRALESILDKMTLDCTYKSKGCKAKLTRKEVSSHTGTCAFGGTKIKLCEKLGYTCDFVLNTNQMQQARAHFTETHSSSTATTSKFTYTINSVPEDGIVSTHKTWKPKIVDIFGESFLVFIMHNKQAGHVSMHFLMTSGDMIKSPSAFRGEFRIKTQKIAEFPDLSWSSSPIHIKHALHTINDPIFRFPQQMWKGYRTKEGKIDIEFSVTRTEQAK